MSVYTVCPNCGAHLDPGERCDCEDPDEEETAQAHSEANETGNMHGSLQHTMPL